MSSCSFCRSFQYREEWHPDCWKLELTENLQPIVHRVKPYHHALKIVAVWGLMLLLGLAGCRIGWLPASPETLDDRTFMELWRIYQHCRFGSDLEAMAGDLQRLKHGASLLISGTTRIPLPPVIARHIELPKPRRAVDPRAMVLAGALRAGAIALETGRPRIAADLFRLTLHEASGPEYAFYAVQARHGLMLAMQSPYGPCVVSIQHDGAPQGEKTRQPGYSATPHGQENQSATQGIVASGFPRLGTTAEEEVRTGCGIGLN